MLNIKNQHRKSSSPLSFSKKHPIILQGIGFLLLFLWATSIIGCTPKPTPTQAFVYPTSMAYCLPHSVFTADDMRARVDCHPDEYKMEITKDTVILFSFPDPIIDWVGSMPIFIIHIPSLSEVILNTDGSIFSEHYKSSEGQNAIDEVLSNKELRTSIPERAKEIWK